MSISVKVIGAVKESDEYQAALRLKEKLENEIPKNVNGDILLYASVTLYGQTVKDVDLLMIGILDNYFYEYRNSKKDKVKINSFCTTIEIKSHDISGISRQGTDLYVNYGRRKHCVTDQSNKQKFALKNFIQSLCGASPYITNLIWFTSVTKNEIEELLTERGKMIPANVFGNDFSINTIIELLLSQRDPLIINGNKFFDSNCEEYGIEGIRNIFSVFLTTKESVGELTRKRIEQITDKTIQSVIPKTNEEKLCIYRGRAGTGKTIGLIQNAIKLVDDEQARVLVLTYNRALVSDIRRLFALADLPDLFNESCVSINTMHSYFFNVIKEGLYEGNLQINEFLDKYEQYLKEMIDFLNDSEGSLEYMKELCQSSAVLSWDYVMVDEAQDWSVYERDLLLNLYQKKQIIIADGGQQFVRNINVCDWSAVPERNNIKLKKCLRQKNNLVKFINHYIEHVGNYGNSMTPSEKMTGGRVKILANNDLLFKLHEEEMERLIDSGNIAYDMLYLVPSNLVRKKGLEHSFSQLTKFEKNGIHIWDGTNEQIRRSFSLQKDEVRMLQYDSARGLEAWTVVCLGFDTFLREKEQLFDPDENVNVLMLESEDDRKRKYMLNWALIPLTRAIDTIVICLDDKESFIGKILKKLAEEYADYIDWVETSYEKSSINL